MKYRVKTMRLNGFDKGDIIEKSADSYVKNQRNHCLRIPKQIVENTPEWFEPIPKVKVGQYWRINISGTIKLRIQKIDGDTIHHKNIRTGYEDFCSETALRKNCQLLSESEVKEALFEEHSNRYKDHLPCKVDYFDTGIKPLRGVEGRTYHPEFDVITVHTMHDKHECEVYKQGEWAEIIKDKWRIEETPYLRIRKGGLVINCQHETEPEEGFEREEAEAIVGALNKIEDTYASR